MRLTESKKLKEYEESLRRLERNLIKLLRMEREKNGVILGIDYGIEPSIVETESPTTPTKGST